MEVAGRLPWDSPDYAHRDVRVSDCQAFGNTGDPGYLKNHSGSGIVLYQVDGGRMERCVAWGNGALCASKGGGVGLWTCASRHVNIECCESFANRTSGADGGGFDIDGGSVECVLQYNYSHDNDGPGLMAYTYPYASHSDRGNVIRFNISENDSRRSRTYAGIWVRADETPMTGLEVYNNTVVIGPWSDQAAWVSGRGVQATFRNNLFLASGAAWPLRVDQPGDGLRFENNLYWREGGKVRIGWGKAEFTNLERFRAATGQERAGTTSFGWFANPELSAHGPGTPSGRRLEGLRAFRPRAHGRVARGGLDLLQRFGLEAGGRDFFGQRLPAASGRSARFWRIRNRRHGSVSLPTGAATSRLCP